MVELLNNFPSRSYVWVNSGGLPPTLMEVNRPATWSWEVLAIVCPRAVILGERFGAKNSFNVFLKSIYSQRKGAQMQRVWWLAVEGLGDLFIVTHENMGSIEGVNLGLWIRRFKVGMMMAPLWARHHCLMGWDRVWCFSLHSYAKVVRCADGWRPPFVVSKISWIDERHSRA